MDDCDRSPDGRNPAFIGHGTGNQGGSWCRWNGRHFQQDQGTLRENQRDKAGPHFKRTGRGTQRTGQGPLGGSRRRGDIC